MLNNNSVQIKIISVLAGIILLFLGYLLFVTITPKPSSESSFVITEVLQDNDNLANPISFKNATIIPQANFHVTGLVLSRKKYFIGKESKFSPMDLAMGWGAMANENVVSQLKISQHNRWFYWKAKKFPIPRREIEKHSANMHIIPADDLVKKKLMKTQKDNIVRFSGYLVRVVANNWTWQSSLTRNDTGNHACEVVFVNEFEILN